MMAFLTSLALTVSSYRKMNLHTSQYNYLLVSDISFLIDTFFSCLMYCWRQADVTEATEGWRDS